MASDGTPPAKRVYMGPPPSARVPDTMYAMSELEMRREVHMLKAEVQILREHGEHTMNMHNALAHETISMVDLILGRMSGYDASWDDAKAKLMALEQSQKRHDQYFVDADTTIKANKKELEERVAMTMEEVQKLTNPKSGLINDLWEKTAFMEHHYVPDAIQAGQDKTEKELTTLRDRWIPKVIEQVERKMEQDLKDTRDAGKNFATDAQVLDSVITAALNERFAGLTSLVDQMGLKIAESCDGRVAVVEVAVNKVYEGCKTKLSELEQEILTVMNHTVSVSKMVEEHKCPCASGRCPCACSQGRESAARLRHRSSPGQGSMAADTGAGHRERSRANFMVRYDARRAEGPWGSSRRS